MVGAAAGAQAARAKENNRNRDRTDRAFIFLLQGLNRIDSHGVGCLLHLPGFARL
jgi:hypothetical protein